jgi:CxxC-x17-CxxC domain-containing protein
VNYWRRKMERSRKPNFKRNFGPRKMHKTTCSECGEECEVPFKPTEGRPVYCKECFRKKKRY